MALSELVVDFDSYFASAEQLARPELRGRPVAVVPLLAETTSCIAVSKEAKRLGLPRGTRVAEARRLCPGLCVVEARPDYYVRLHNQVVDLIEHQVHVTRVLSIDEVECALTARFAPRTEAEALARRIKRALRDQLGPELTCSIGVAPNGWLAKIGSDMGKPDGLVILDQEDLPGALLPLALRDLPGIGPRMERRLHRHGITTVAQLWAARREQLHALWGGVGGWQLYERLRGLPVETPEASLKRTIGHSHVLSPDLRSEAGARPVLHRLLQKAAMRLRYHELYAAGLAIHLRLENHTEWGAESRLEETQDTLKLLHTLNRLWDGRPASLHLSQPCLVGVTLLELIPAKEHTLSLFDPEEKRLKLHAAIDRLNRILGKNTLYFAGAHGAHRYTPLRIAFTRIPDDELENLITTCPEP